MPDFVMKDICKSFPGVKALDHANFNADKGDIVALLGANGAGKSTLIKVLSGEHKADSGEIYYEGKPLNVTSTKNAIEQKICVVYQELSLVPELTVAENLFLGFYETDRLGRVNYKELERKTVELFKKYDLDLINPKEKVKNLSLSQKQLLEILKSLNRNGDIFIFDEATSALVEKSTRWLMAIIQRLSEEKKIIIFISHRLDEIRKLCPRVIVYRAGTDVADLKMDETNPEQLVSLMLGREIGGYYPQKEDSTKPDVVRLSMKNINCGHFLKDINLELHAGEILGVGGLAGQGQSELFKCLFGLLPYTGDIEVNNEKVRLNSTGAAQGKGIALIPEERGVQGVILKQSIRENIALACLDKVSNGIFLSKEKENKIVDENMKAFSIKAESADTLVGTLSGGNQQKVVLAKELSTQPDIILMYDITRGVDVGTKKEMFNINQRYAREGKAILFYSTDSEELMNVCNSVIVMNNGKIVGRLDQELLSRENILRISVGEDAV
jgi:ABC-type sugar transport system ATPase subunit